MKLFLHYTFVATLLLLNALHGSNIQGIDTHIHLYEPVGLDWLKPENKPLFKPHHASHYQALASDTPINQVILVEAGTTLEHNEWMLQHASENALIGAVIGNLYLESPDFAENLKRFAQHPKFRGIRNRAQGPVDFNSERVQQHLALMAEHKMIFESGVSQGSAKSLARVAQQFPDLTIILNHMAGGVLNPKNQPQAWWPKTVVELAQYPNVYCKLSMYDIAFRKDYTPERMTTLFQPLIDAFGPDRLLYGSNWPVTSDFEGMLDIFNQSVAQSDLKKRILIDNPMQAYQLKE